MNVEIDAKAKMQERMAKMRAAKGKKAAPAPKPKKQQEVLRVPDNLPEKPIIEAPNDAAAPLKLKEWTIGDFADLCGVPEEHVDYFFVTMRIEVKKAIRAKQKINNFVFNEQHKLQTFLKSEDVFD